MSEDVAVVLAAGKGTRMRSEIPKVLHPLAGKTMVERVINTLNAAGISSVQVVVGHGAALIRQVLGDRCTYIEQGQQLGTGHAARVAIEQLPATADRIVLVHGDEPLIDLETYGAMLELQARSGAAIVLLTTRVDDTRSFGRVIRDDRGHPCALLQESDLSPQQRALKEVNLGVYVFDRTLLERYLRQLEPHPPKGEYYLTDVVAMAAGDGVGIEALTIEGGEEVMGVNDLIQLEGATKAIYRRKNRELMASGVTIVDSASTFVDEDVEIEAGTTLLPFTVIRGASRIGPDCTIGPGAHIVSSQIAAGCSVLSSTVEESTVDSGVRIGPYSHLRPGARIGRGVVIGNYAEVKRSTLGEGTHMHHMSYVGDAEVGANVNIGAGTITCNFDGTAKHATIIEDDAFIGSDTMLRAPVRIGRGAVTGAGTVVTRDVAPGATVAGVPGRVIKEGSEKDHSEVDQHVEESGVQSRRGA